MLTVDRVIAAPPQAAWDVLVDLDAWPQWGPTVRHAALDPAFPQLSLHATGTVQSWLPVPLRFVVTEFDPGRRWSWAVAGVGATSHAVDPVDGRARVTFGVPWWAGAYLPVCAVALRRIEGLLTRPR
jgi:uncharacterized protein YndB with AHSA1/START domain